MSYLVIGKPRIAAPRDAETWRAAKEWVEKRQANGEVELVRAFVEVGIMMIVDQPSHEDLMRFIRSFPPFPAFEWTVNPLCDIIEALDWMIEAHET